MPFVNDFDVGVQAARQSQKPVLLYFSGLNDAQCRDIEHRVVLPRWDEIERDFVVIRMFADVLPNSAVSQESHAKIQHAQRLLQDRFQEHVLPLLVVLTSDGQTELRRFGITDFHNRPEAFSEFLSNRRQ